MSFKLMMVLLFCVECIFSSFGIAQENIWSFQIGEQKNEQFIPRKYKQKSSFGWSTNQDGAHILRWKVLADTDLDFASDPISTSTTKAEIKTKASRMQLTTESMGNDLKLKSGLKLRFILKLNEPLIIDDDCKKADLTFQPNSKAAPFYIGISCVVIKDQVKFHLSFPVDVDLVQSSLFESLGKGENFRVYDLKKITAARGKMGDFKFSYLGRDFEYSLMSLKKAGAEDSKTTESRFMVGLGYGVMSLSSIINNYKAAKPYVGIALRPRKILGNLAMGVGFENAIGSTDAAYPGSMSYFQVSGFATYILSLSSWAELQPRMYYVVSNQNTGSGVGYQTSQFGAGLWSQLQISQRFYLHLEGMTEAISSPVISAHYFAEVGLFYRDLGLSSGWGIAVQSQNYTVTDSLENTRRFDQTFYVLKRAF